jgi:hypothetical protein
VPFQFVRHIFGFAFNEEGRYSNLMRVLMAICSVFTPQRV